MTKEELISKGKHKVRNTPSLMSVYIELFTIEFGNRPNCAGCTFDSDWGRFTKTKATTKTTSKHNTMENTFKLKMPTSEILSYRKGKVTYRKYANKANDTFMSEYLTHGTDEELEKRRKMFKVFPASFEAKPIEPMTMTVAKIKEYLDREDDIEKVRALLEGETRVGALKEINARIAELEA